MPLKQESSIAYRLYWLFNNLRYTPYFNQRLCRFQSRGNRVFQLFVCQAQLFGNRALPNNQNLPSGVRERSVVPLVASLITFDFVGPEFRSGFGRTEKMAVVVTVPIAAVHEDYSFPLWKYDIGAPWQVSAMKAEPVAKPVKQATHDDLRTGVFPPNTRHHGTALFRGNDVCH